MAPQALPCTFTGAWFPGAGWLTDGLVARVAVAAPQVHSRPKPCPAVLVYVTHRPGLTDMASPTLSHIITLPTVTPRPQQAGLLRLSVPLGSQGQASLSRWHPSPHRHLCWWAAHPHHSVLALLRASGEGRAPPHGESAGHAPRWRPWGGRLRRARGRTSSSLPPGSHSFPTKEKASPAEAWQPGDREAGLRAGVCAGARGFLLPGHSIVGHLVSSSCPACWRPERGGRLRAALVMEGVRPPVPCLSDPLCPAQGMACGGARGQWETAPPPSSPRVGRQPPCGRGSVPVSRLLPSTHQLQ